MTLLDTKSVIIVVGAAGSGKTYVPARHALQRLESGKIDRIIITRPTTAPQRHRQGFQPGNSDQKMRPWMRPIVDAFKEGVTGANLDRHLNHKKIEILPFEHMRGITVANGVFLLDEAQNCTLADLELFLTRIGENSQAIICGDPSQSDLDQSGLETVIEIARQAGIDIGLIVFDEKDVVRSETAAEWVAAFARYKKSKGTPFL